MQGASAPTARSLAAALDTLRREKETRLREIDEKEAKSISAAQEETKRTLADLEEAQAALDARRRREATSLDELRRSIEANAANVWHEDLTGSVHRRITEFRGADGSDLKERLIKEGFGESPVIDGLRRRTLDQHVENPGGLQARFTASDTERERNPLEAIMDREARLYDLTDKRVLDRLGTISSDARERGYITTEDKQFVENVAYLSGQMQENDAYREKDERQYLSRAHDLADGIRRDLGLDTGWTSLTYGRNS